MHSGLSKSIWIVGCFSRKKTRRKIKYSDQDSHWDSLFYFSVTLTTTNTKSHVVTHPHILFYYIQMQLWNCIKIQNLLKLKWCAISVNDILVWFVLGIWRVKTSIYPTVYTVDKDVTCILLWHILQARLVNFPNFFHMSVIRLTPETTLLPFETSF